VITSPDEFDADNVFVDLEGILGHRLYLKCEGFNFAGSIKLKAAAALVAAAEEEGRLGPESMLVESSSGNLGVALAVIAAARGYRFLCVTDDRCNPSTLRMIEALGSQVHVVTEPAAQGGLLGARIAHVRALCAADDSAVWLDQYHNAANWQAHYSWTAPEVLSQFPDLDVLFVGAGTTGTLMGCARFLRDWSVNARIVAIDAVGSVSFGGEPARRVIPGLGAGVRPPLLDASYVDDVVLVSEADTVRTCRRLARGGFVFGGSTGTVVAGAEHWLAEHGGPALTSVAIAPDLGGRYLDTIYDDSWVADHVSEPAANVTDIRPMTTDLAPARCRTG
jgi:2,3-diaminopropionate biosynthesis protein SbnA